MATRIPPPPRAPGEIPALLLSDYIEEWLSPVEWLATAGPSWDAHVRQLGARRAWLVENGLDPQGADFLKAFGTGAPFPAFRDPANLATWRRAHGLAVPP